MTASSGLTRSQRPGGSMSLLDDIARQALDPAYADAAARRALLDPSGATVRRPARRGLAIGGVLALTLLLVLAAVQTHRRAPLDQKSRQSLVDEVHRETGSVGALERRLDALRDSTQQLRNGLLETTTAGSALAKRLDAADLVAGTVAATGPGLRVVVDDAQSDGTDNQVLDRDLQGLVNALWAAGAEAIAIDDERLTAQSAIRQAGSSILVNFEPVGRPYVITAIGDPVGLATSFGASAAVARMHTYTQVYGLQFRFARVDELTVPRAPGLPLRFAKPVVGRRTGEAKQ